MKKWSTQPGRLWEIGPHRAISGDCTDETVVRRLFESATPARFRMTCDPPCGVAYSAKNEFLNALDRGNRVQKPIDNDQDPDVAPQIFPSVNLTMVAYPGSYRVSGRQADRAEIYVCALFPCAQLQRNVQDDFSSAAISGIHARPDICWGVPTPSRRSILRSTHKNTRYPTRLASPSGFQSAAYRPLFEPVGAPARSTSIFQPTREQICDTPEARRHSARSATPIVLPGGPHQANDVFDHWGHSIDQYEPPGCQRFSSKFDAFLVGKYTITATRWLIQAVQCKGNCNSCHVTEEAIALHRSSEQHDTGSQQHDAEVHLLRLGQ